MKLTLVEPKYLKDSLTIVSELVNDARFKITKDSVDLVAMDPANVAMVLFKLLSSSFTEYDVKKEAEIAINLSNLKQILRRVNPTDVLTLELTKDNKLKIELKGQTKRTFQLPLIELEEREQKVPSLKFPVTVKTRASILTGAVEDADIVAESLTFAVDSGRLLIEAEGDMNKASIELNEDDTTKIATDAKEKIKSRYSIEYLKKMIPAAKLAEEVTIKFNTDYPLKLEYKVVDKLMLGFILAPRVENE